MLAHARGAETVCARIEELDLGRRFACVLLMSNLVNSDEERSDFLAACARHVRPDGVVLIERHPSDWNPEAGKPRQLGNVRIELEDVHIDPSVVAGTVRYDAAGRVWRHPFRTHLLDDEELARELATAGLEFIRTLDDGGAWVEAKLA